MTSIVDVDGQSPYEHGLADGRRYARRIACQHGDMRLLDRILCEGSKNTDDEEYLRGFRRGTHVCRRAA